MTKEEHTYLMNRVYKTLNGNKVKAIYGIPSENIVTLWVDVVYANNDEEWIDHFIVSPLDNVDVHSKEQLENFFEEYFAQVEY